MADLEMQEIERDREKAKRDAYHKLECLILDYGTAKMTQGQHLAAGDMAAYRLAQARAESLISEWSAALHNAFWGPK